MGQKDRLEERQIGSRNQIVVLRMVNKMTLILYTNFRQNQEITVYLNQSLDDKGVSLRKVI